MPVSKLVLTPVLVAVILMSAGLSAAISEQPSRSSLPRPSIQYEPADVVRIVIDALANNDQPYADAGIETTFAFASPANKVNTGPLSKFAKMVRTPAYGIMIDHVEREFSEVVMMADKAYQMVKVVGGSGAEVVFAFRLGRQADGEFEGMWMTDAVWPVASGDIPQQAF